ncbi:hypothetical protein NFI00_000076 [Salmonella enterica]|nr:hypothetical protein [Salmonella enterica]
MDETIDNFDMIAEEPIEAEFAGEHAATLIEGMMDTVAGNEAYNGGLTHAQEYLKAVLAADGVSFANVHGMEGVMDKIKAGAHKAWEAIKRAFKAVWSFFFDKKIERQAKGIFDTAKEYRQKASAKADSYSGEASKEGMQKRFDMIEKVETYLDEKADAAAGRVGEITENKNLAIPDPIYKILRSSVDEIRTTYNLMNIMEGLKKPSDISSTLTKLEEVTKKIVAHQEKVRNAKSVIDGEMTGAEHAMESSPDAKDKIEPIMKILKVVAEVFNDYIVCVQRKLNLVGKLVSSIDRVFVKQAAA